MKPEFPANFIAETTATELAVMGDGIESPSANKTYYRVVAVDSQGKRSGPSDYATAPRPTIYGKPATQAKVGTEYRCQLQANRSLGDLRLRMVGGKETANFWDIEKLALLGGVALAQQQTTIAIATGGTGGVYYPLGGGMANVLTKYVPGYAATARVTGGSVDNLKLIGTKQSEVAMVMVDAAVDALKGDDKFKGMAA